MCQVTMVFYNFRFEDLKIDCKKRSNMTKCQKWKFNSRRGFYLCYWIIRVIFDTSQKFLDKWMSGIDFHGFLLVEVVITLHIMGFWMGLTSNNSLHISSPSKSGKMNVLFDSKFWVNCYVCIQNYESYQTDCFATSYKCALQIWL